MVGTQLGTGRQGRAEIGVLVAVAIVGLVIWASFNPETIRTPLQVPVSVTVRPSAVGIGNVVQVRNTSALTLTGVVITARNTGTNSAATHRIGAISPGQVAEAGWMEWNWRVDPGETVSVSADGFVPIVFSSAQLGVR